MNNTDREKAYKEKVSKVVDEDSVQLDDGYLYISMTDGVASANDLRAMADELDKRNKGWDEKVNADLWPTPESEGVIDKSIKNAIGAVELHKSKEVEKLLRQARQDERERIKQAAENQMPKYHGDKTGFGETVMIDLDDLYSLLESQPGDSDE